MLRFSADRFERLFSARPKSCSGRALDDGVNTHLAKSMCVADKWLRGKGVVSDKLLEGSSKPPSLALIPVDCVAQERPSPIEASGMLLFPSSA